MLAHNPLVLITIGVPTTSIACHHFCRHLLTQGGFRLANGKNSVNVRWESMARSFVSHTALKLSVRTENPA